MFAAYSHPQKVIGQFIGTVHGAHQTFQIAELQADELAQAAELLKTVQAQLAEKDQGHLLKTRSVEELQKYYIQGAIFLGVYATNDLVGMSMVTPVKHFAQLGRVQTPPNLTDLPFNGLTEDVMGLHTQEAKPEDFCVFGAMAINQNYGQLGMAQKLWPYRLKAALNMGTSFACTTISATNTAVLKHYINQGWLMDDTQTVIENGKEIILHRFIANHEILAQNLMNAQKPPQSIPTYA